MHDYLNAYKIVFAVMVKICNPIIIFLRKASGFLPVLLVSGLLLLLLLPEAKGQHCTGDTPVLDVNLSSSPDASLDFFSVTPDGGCCPGSPSNFDCIELLITLHPYATSVTIVFTTATGNLWYYLDCAEQLPSPSNNVLNLCFDDPGPHSVIFCRTDNDVYSFHITSHDIPFVVTLDPMDPVCEDSPSFPLPVGSPAGGTYYVNGSEYWDTHLDPTSLIHGNQTITYEYTNSLTGCSGIAEQNLLVVATPTVSWAGQELCYDTGWAPLSGGSPPEGTYTGNYVVSNQFNTGAALPGNHPITYSYTDTYGCSASVVDTVVVHNPPIANAGSDQTNTMGSTFIFNEATTGGTGSYTYEWSPAHLLVDPNVQNPQTLAINETTIFTLTVTDDDTGCEATDELIIKITGGPLHITQVIGLPAEICEGESTQLRVLPGGGSGNYNYAWISNPFDPSLVTPNDPMPVVSPTQTTMYTVAVTDADVPPPSPAVHGTTTITVNDLPDVGFLPGSDDEVCANTPGYAFQGGYPEGGIYYLLDTSGNLLNLPYIDFSNFLPDDIGAGDYQIMYEFTDVNGCSNFAIKPFTILPYVEAQFYVHIPDVCAPNVVHIANHSTGAVSYFWDFDDGTTATTTDPTFTHTYPVTDETIEYTITQVAYSAEGCWHERKRKIKITPPVIANFTSTATEGCSPHDVEFFNQSEGIIIMNFWDFGDGTFSVEQHPAHTFTNNSDHDTTFVFTVSLTVISANFLCPQTHTMDITVYPYIEAGFTVNPVAGCSELDVVIGNTAIGAVTSWDWDFGNGQTSTEENPDTIPYSNTTSSIVSYTITQVVSNTHCSDSISHPIEVYPEITANFTASVIDGCSPLEVDFTNLTTGPATLYTWDFGDGGSSATLGDVSHTFINTTNASIEYTVVLMAQAGVYCAHSDTVLIIVHPWLQAGFDFQPAQACHPLDADEYELIIVNTADGAIDNFLWNFDFPGPDGTSTSSADTLFVLLEHDNLTPETYNIHLLVSNEHCTDTLMRPFTLLPKIVADFTPSVTEGCDSLEVIFENNSLGAENYLWEFGINGSSGSTTDSDPVHIFENTSYTDVATFDVWLYTESEYLCRDSIRHQITVFPRIKADFSIPESKGCSPFTMILENHSLGASQLHWDFGGLHTITTDNTADYLLWNFENYTDSVITFDIVLIAENETFHNGETYYCIDTLVHTITVYPEVLIQYSHELEGCHPLPVYFDNATENANYYSWTYGDGMGSTQYSPSHVFNNYNHTDSVVYNVSYYASSIYGCNATDTSQVIVLPKPLASFELENSPGCSPYEISISHNSIGATSYVWDFDDGNGTFAYSETSFTHSPPYNVEPGAGPGYFNIELITVNTFGCSDTLSRQAIVYPNITAAFDPDVTEGCHPLTIDFSNLSTGATAATSYYWDYGNGNSSNNLQSLHSHTFHNFSHTQDTTYTVMLVAYNENACSDTTWHNITVLPRPMAFFSVPNVPACGPHTANIHNFAIGAENYLWDMGDGSDPLTYTQAHFTHDYTQPAGQGPGVFTITLTVDNEFGCDHSYSQQIVIYPEIHAAFATQDDIWEGCHVHEAVFQNLTEGGDMYWWDFGNGNTSQSTNPMQAFTNYSHTESETYIINLLTESHYGCTSSTTHEIIVRPLPKPEFSISELSGCSPFTPELENISIGAIGYAWNMGDGETHDETGFFTHTYHNTSELPVNFTLMLEAWNEFNCHATTQQIITVFPEVTAEFTTENEIWEGCSPLTLRFLNESLLASNYNWEFGDDEVSTSANPLHIFYNNEIDNKIYEIQLAAHSIYGCSDTIAKEVTVFPAPEAYFTALPKKQAYPDATITLNNLSSEGYWNFHWEFGDGNTFLTPVIDPFTHTYIWDPNDMATKTYIVALMVSNEHCTDMHTQEVTITSPVPEAEFSNVTTGCEPFTLQFANTSLYAHTYRWEFGDGSISVHPEPEHTFVDHGYYEIMLIAIGDGGRDTTYRYVEVHQNPTAQFSLKKAHINIPEEPLELFNASELGDFYLWDFGDGNTSTAFEPVYYYDTPGIYNISLLVTRNTEPQCHDMMLKENALRVDETCKIIFPNAFKPNITGPSGGHVDPGNPSTEIFHPVYEGVDNYVLEIYTRWGELIYRSEDINVGWDGYVQGKLSSMDVYVWKVTGVCTNGKSFTHSGDVTLYR